MGYEVPWAAIPNIKRATIPDDWLTGFEETLDTSEKGRRAVQVVSRLLQKGRFPLWTEGEEIRDVQLQIKGTDIGVTGRWTIQVKCDYRCGETDRGGRDYLFLQVAERNPLRKI